jgi:hypothetical protein
MVIEEMIRKEDCEVDFNVWWGKNEENERLRKRKSQVRTF